MIASQVSRIQAINAATVKDWFDHDKVLLVDVREPVEYAGEHIPGATLLPLSSFDPSQLPIADDKPLVLYCRTSNRSGLAARKLLDAGFDQVLHLDAGLDAWHRLGYPVNINKNAPISIMRQVQISAGSLMLLGTVLGVLVSPWFLLLSGFVGSGLLYAGLSGTCMMATLLAKLPYNQRVA